jgi:hypothetical protein
MRVGKSGIVAGVALGMTLSGAAHPAKADDQGLLALGAGIYDFIGNNDKPAGMFRAEYRFANGLFFIKPLIGAFVTTDTTFYGYGGLRADIILAQHYVIMPVATVGYWERGDGKDLGSHIEFKTGAEFAYRFDGGSRIGVAFDHMSNAGITQRNPGEESVLVVYSLPIGLPF